MNGQSIRARTHPCSSLLIRGLRAPIRRVGRLILVPVCGLAVLLVPNLDGDGIHDRIEFQRGSRELARSGHLHSPHARLTRHLPKPGVRGVQTVPFDDSELNDSNRLLIAGSAPTRVSLILVGETPVLADTALPNFTFRRRPPRGPPTRLVS